MSEIEKMYKLANIAKPVIKKWYYDGYYEDFSWKSSKEDCTELLKYFDNSIDKLNDRIQQMKKEENTKYDRYTDSVNTEFGRIEKAYIDYPPFTIKKQIELIKWFVKTFAEIETLEINYRLNDCFQISSCNSVSKFEFEFEEALASFISNLYLDLTDDQKEEIRMILQ